MSMDDLAAKGGELLDQGKKLYEDNKDKIDDVIHSDQAEDVSDSVLDKVADFAKGVLPEDMHGHVDGVRDSVDGAVGNE